MIEHPGQALFGLVLLVCAVAILVGAGRSVTPVERDGSRTPPARRDGSLSTAEVVLVASAFATGHADGDGGDGGGGGD